MPARFTSAVLLAAVLLAAPVAVARAGTAPSPAPAAPPAVEAVRATTPVRLDGRDDEAFWAAAPVVTLGRIDSRAPREATRVRFAWDADNLYLFAELEDDDAVATARSDRQPQQTEGDVLELFIGPSGRTWYWELHYTPGSRRAAFFFPSAGRRLGSNITEGPRPRHRHAARVDGTLNDWRDHDSRWTVEIAIPWAGLVVDDGTDAPSRSGWRVLLGRYDYSRWQDEVEITFWPPLPALRFHRPDLFAPLRLLDADAATIEAPLPAAESGKSSKRSRRNARG